MINIIAKFISLLFISFASVFFLDMLNKNENYYNNKKKKLTFDNLFIDKRKKIKLKTDFEKYLKILNKNSKTNAKIQSLKYIFHGRPGLGKTMTANVLVDVFDLELIDINPSDILNQFVGGSERNIKNIFLKARYLSKTRNVLILINEIEKLFSNNVLVNTNSCNSMTTQILNELDDISEYKNIFIIGTTNNYKIIKEPIFSRLGGKNGLIEFNNPNKETKGLFFQFKIKELNKDFILGKEIYNDLDKFKDFRELKSLVNSILLDFEYNIENKDDSTINSVIKKFIKEKKSINENDDDYSEYM